MALNPRVLLADADPTLARTLAWMLKQNGYDVSTAGTFDHVEAVLGAEQVDLVLLDLALAAARPGALHVLRNTRHAAPAVLWTTLQSPTPELTESLSLAADAVIRKPFQIRDLLERMRQALRAHRLGSSDRDIQQEIASIFSEMTGLHDFDDFCRALVRGVSRVLKVPRCSVILAEPGATSGVVVAASDNPVLRHLPVNLERYPEILRALGSEGPVLVSDVTTDPLFDTVRPLWGYAPDPVDTMSAIAVRFGLSGGRTGVFFIRTSDRAVPLSTADVRFTERVITAAVAALEEASVRSGPLTLPGGA